MGTLVIRPGDRLRHKLSGQQCLALTEPQTDHTFLARFRTMNTGDIQEPRKLYVAEVEPWPESEPNVQRVRD